VSLVSSVNKNSILKSSAVKAKARNITVKENCCYDYGDQLSPFPNAWDGMLTGLQTTLNYQ